MKKYYFDDWVIESSNQDINLKDTIDLILDFNENKNEDEDKDYENENEYKNEDEDDENENEDDNDKRTDQNKIKDLNDYFDKIIDKPKSFKDQIKLLKKEKI